MKERKNTNLIKYSRSTANKTQPNQTKKKKKKIILFLRDSEWVPCQLVVVVVVVAAQRLSSEEGREKEMKLQFSPF
jgi:hypothetical protein